jgi:acetyl esterase/lipase
LKHFPPTLLQVGEFEVLYDENVEFMMRLQKVNPYDGPESIDHTYHPKYMVEIYKSMFHGYHTIGPNLPTTDTSYRNIRVWTTKQTLI